MGTAQPGDLGGSKRGEMTMSKTTLNVLVSLGIAAVFMYLAFRSVSWDEIATALAKFDTAYLLPAIVVSLLIQVFRAWRWQLELSPLEHVPLGRVWVVTSVAYMAINLLPARLGEFVRPWLMSRRSNVSFSNVVGNLVVEKTMDSVSIVFYILLGLLTTSNLPPWVRQGAIVPAVAAAVLVILVILLWTKGEGFFDRWIIAYLPERFGGGLKKFVRALLDGMKILPNPILVATVFVVSLLLWFLPILSSYIAILAFSFDVPFNAALIVFIFIGFGTALPQAPGMIGTYQYACILALGLFGVERADALAYGIVLNGIQLITLIAQGLVALPFAGVTLADFRRARAEIAQEESNA